MFYYQLWVTQKSVSQNKIILQIHHSMKFLMTLLSKLNNLFNELSHRWRLHWRLFRSNSKSFSKSNCVRHLGNKLHTRTHTERTQNRLQVPVPHTTVCQSKESREGKQWFVPEKALLLNSCWFRSGQGKGKKSRLRQWPKQWDKRQKIGWATLLFSQ